MVTGNLPLLRGTPAQVGWANTIRFQTLGQPRTPDELMKLSQINDAAWWIGNRDKDHDRNDQLTARYKEPAPYQLVGGPPPPGQTPDLFPKRQSPENEPHDAELFAQSACQIPALGELAVLATFSRLYKGEEARLFRSRVELRLEGLRERLIAELDKDIDGIRRILGKK